MPVPDEIVQRVREAYSSAALSPEGKHPFPVGQWFAESLGYDTANIPEVALQAFAGVSNISMTAVIPPGSTVLDLGCGSGVDSIVAARRTGGNGKVFSVDFSDAMLYRARAAMRDAGLPNVEVLPGEADRIPIPEKSVDVAIVNGIFNLNPARASIFSEVFRVLRPGGTAFNAELILTQSIPEEQRTASNWFA